MDPAGFEPAAFALRTQRSTPDLQALKKYNIKKYKVFLHPAEFDHGYALYPIYLAEGFFDLLSPAFDVPYFDDYNEGF